MDVAKSVLARIAARAAGKELFEISDECFKLIKKYGSTHYCFDCDADYGFVPNADGMPRLKNELMVRHDPETHAEAVVGNVDKYNDLKTWLDNSLPKNFPYFIVIK